MGEHYYFLDCGSSVVVVVFFLKGTGLQQFLNRVVWQKEAEQTSCASQLALQPLSRAEERLAGPLFMVDKNCVHVRRPLLC